MCGHNGTLGWDRSWGMAEVTLGCPHSPQDRPESLWNRVRSVTWANLLIEHPDFQMRPTAKEQQQQIHELEARQKLKQKPPPGDSVKPGSLTGSLPAPGHRQKSHIRNATILKYHIQPIQEQANLYLLDKTTKHKVNCTAKMSLITLMY